MFTDKNIIYSEPGCFLKYKNQIAFQFPEADGIEENKIKLTDLYVLGNTAYYNGGTLAQRINKNWSYADYKKDIIKKRYSNDDQIAIMLNKEDSEDDLIRYQMMMRWREFASRLAKAIMKKIK